MSSNGDAQIAGRQPRSLTLTFAETHPWERLVRDRLNALPRGYLKRFVLLLIERAGVDLTSDEAFRAQVEQALLIRDLPGRDLAGKPASQMPMALEQHITPVRPAESMAQALEPSLRGFGDEKRAGGTASSEPPRASLPTLPASVRSGDPRQPLREAGFGALEL